MKRGVTVAVVIGCSFGCGAAEDGGHDDSADGVAGAISQAEDDSSEDTSNARTPASVGRRICDGSAGIRLALGFGGGGPPSPYTSVLSELGYDFLYVDGSCHYWVHQ